MLHQSLILKKYKLLENPLRMIIGVKTSIEFDLTHYKFADCHHITLFYSIKKALIIINFSINPLK